MFYTVNRRTLVGVSLCLVLALVITLTGAWYGRTDLAVNGNWGLSFQTEGEAPVGNATADFLKQYSACCLNCADIIDNFLNIRR